MAKHSVFFDEHKEWRGLFPPDILETAERLYRKGAVIHFSSRENSATAILEPGRGKMFSVRLEAPSAYEQNWEWENFSCTCVAKRSFTFRELGRQRRAIVCQHEAAALLAWEEEHGPWDFPAPPEIRQARLEAEKEKKRREAERKKLEKLKKTMVRADSFFPDPEQEEVFFQVKKAVSGMMTSQYSVERARTLLEDKAVSLKTTRVSYHRSGAQMLEADAEVEDGDNTFSVNLQLLPEELLHNRCSCRGYYWYSSSPELCEHELAVLTELRTYIARENPGDATTLAANEFFQAMDNQSSLQELEEEAASSAVRPRRIRLAPKLAASDGALLLSYIISVDGGKALQLRNYKGFLRDVENQGVFSLSKSVSLNFAEADFTEESLPWFTFLQRRVSETEVANDKLNSSRGYYYSYSSPSLSVKTKDALIGATLDRFYELAEGSSVEYQGGAGSLRIGHAKPQVALVATRYPAVGAFQGIQVSGRMPLILKGSAGSYFLGKDCLSKITREEELALRPFQAAANVEGEISFRVGREKLAEFYYRVVPRLLQNPYVDFNDDCEREAEALLPPEPQFTFRFDLDEYAGRITCKVLVCYGEGAPYTLPHTVSGSQYRDAAQEERVLAAVKRSFPQYYGANGEHWINYTEDALYHVLTSAVPELARFGVVEGSSAFDRSAPRPMPQLRVGVSVESGLLEIDLISKDLSPEELLAVLESYRQKKKYHRLNSGAFLKLDGDEQLSELDSVSRNLGVSLEDAIRGGAQAPMYRALYLDSLLEEHDALSSNRDKSYRALIKNFKTIRDADYEVPSAQAETLRPYQVHGYKWLRTLAEAGFGGILADEMGLGKTLQFISLVQAIHDSGDMRPCLVVCPASLLYNWQEEFHRFAPTLTVEVMAGPASVRKKRLAEAADKAVLITSYDLLRQDVAEYRKLFFNLMVLDEAQYIKNQKAAMTKAVKGVKARLRFALTGTPIENRLAELWSIFDFLMPGFLYSYPEFQRRFETPITKQKDPDATARLKQMTSPFILRRLKGDVLKDLPPKLEEVRYTRFEEEQRRVYDGQVVRMKQMVLSSGDGGEDKIRIFAELMRIRQICCDPSLLLEDYRGGSAKRSACLELIQNAMGGGHRMLLFSQFTSMLALLEQDLTEAGIAYFKLTGATPKEQRVRLVREFNEGDTPVFLISLKAGGTGLNLTGADVVIHYDPWWNVAAQNQATDRAHRIGQTNQVTVYRIIVKDSIEERILALQEAKCDLADAVLSGEGTSLSALSNEELLALLD